MLSPRSDPELIAEVEGLCLVMYASAYQTGAMHILPEFFAKKFGVQLAIEGENTICLELRQNGIPVAIIQFLDSGWPAHNAFRDNADAMMEWLRNRCGI